MSYSPSVTSYSEPPSRGPSRSPSAATTPTHRGRQDAKRMMAEYAGLDSSSPPPSATVSRSPSALLLPNGLPSAVTDGGAVAPLGAVPSHVVATRTAPDNFAAFLKLSSFETAPTATTVPRCDDDTKNEAWQQQQYHQHHNGDGDGALPVSAGASVPADSSESIPEAFLSIIDQYKAQMLDARRQARQREIELLGLVESSSTITRSLREELRSAKAEQRAAAQDAAAARAETERMREALLAAADAMNEEEEEALEEEDDDGEEEQEADFEETVEEEPSEHNVVVDEGPPSNSPGIRESAPLTPILQSSVDVVETHEGVDGGSKANNALARLARSSAPVSPRAGRSDSSPGHTSHGSQPAAPAPERAFAVAYDTTAGWAAAAAQNATDRGGFDTVDVLEQQLLSLPTTGPRLWLDATKDFALIASDNLRRRWPSGATLPQSAASAISEFLAAAETLRDVGLFDAVLSPPPQMMPTPTTPLDSSAAVMLPPHHAEAIGGVHLDDHHLKSDEIPRSQSAAEDHDHAIIKNAPVVFSVNNGGMLKGQVSPPPALRPAIPSPTQDSDVVVDSAAPQATISGQPSPPPLPQVVGLSALPSPIVDASGVERSGVAGGGEGRSRGEGGAVVGVVPPALYQQCMSPQMTGSPPPFASDTDVLASMAARAAAGNTTNDARDGDIPPTKTTTTVDERTERNPIDVIRVSETKRGDESTSRAAAVHESNQPSAAVRGDTVAGDGHGMAVTSDVKPRAAATSSPYLVEVLPKSSVTLPGDSTTDEADHVQRASPNDLHGDVASNDHDHDQRDLLKPSSIQNVDKSNSDHAREEESSDIVKSTGRLALTVPMSSLHRGASTGAEAAASESASPLGTTNSAASPHGAVSTGGGSAGFCDAPVTPSWLTPVWQPHGQTPYGHGGRGRRMSGSRHSDRTGDDLMSESQLGFDATYDNLPPMSEVSPLPARARLHRQYTTRGSLAPAIEHQQQLLTTLQERHASGIAIGRGDGTARHPGGEIGKVRQEVSAEDLRRRREIAEAAAAAARAMAAGGSLGSSSNYPSAVLTPTSPDDNGLVLEDAEPTRRKSTFAEPRLDDGALHDHRSSRNRQTGPVFESSETAAYVDGHGELRDQTALGNDTSSRGVRQTTEPYREANDNGHGNDDDNYDDDDDEIPPGCPTLHSCVSHTVNPAVSPQRAMMLSASSSRHQYADSNDGFVSGRNRDTDPSSLPSVVFSGNGDGHNDAGARPDLISLPGGGPFVSGGDGGGVNVSDGIGTPQRQYGYRPRGIPMADLSAVKSTSTYQDDEDGGMSLSMMLALANNQTPERADGHPAGSDDHHRGGDDPWSPAEGGIPSDKGRTLKMTATTNRLSTSSANLTVTTAAAAATTSPDSGAERPRGFGDAHHQNQNQRREGEVSPSSTAADSAANVRSLDGIVPPSLQQQYAAMQQHQHNSHLTTHDVDASPTDAERTREIQEQKCEDEAVAQEDDAPRLADRREDRRLALLKSSLPHEEVPEEQHVDEGVSLSTMASPLFGESAASPALVPRRDRRRIRNTTDTAVVDAVVPRDPHGLGEEQHGGKVYDGDRGDGRGGSGQKEIEDTACETKRSDGDAPAAATPNDTKDGDDNHAKDTDASPFGDLPFTSGDSNPTARRHGNNSGSDLDDEVDESESLTKRRRSRIPSIALEDAIEAPSVGGDGPNETDATTAAPSIPIATDNESTMKVQGETDDMSKPDLSEPGLQDQEHERTRTDDSSAAMGAEAEKFPTNSSNPEPLLDRDGVNKPSSGGSGHDGGDEEKWEDVFGAEILSDHGTPQSTPQSRPTPSTNITSGSKQLTPMAIIDDDDGPVFMDAPVVEAQHQGLQTPPSAAPSSLVDNVEKSDTERVPVVSASVNDDNNSTTVSSLLESKRALDDEPVPPAQTHVNANANQESQNVETEQETDVALERSHESNHGGDVIVKCYHTEAGQEGGAAVEVEIDPVDDEEEDEEEDDDDIQLSSTTASPNMTLNGGGSTYRSPSDFDAGDVAGGGHHGWSRSHSPVSQQSPRSKHASPLSRRGTNPSFLRMLASKPSPQPTVTDAVNVAGGGESSIPRLSESRSGPRSREREHEADTQPTPEEEVQGDPQDVEGVQTEPQETEPDKNTTRSTHQELPKDDAPACDENTDRREPLHIERAADTTVNGTGGGDESTIGDASPRSIRGAEIREFPQHQRLALKATSSVCSTHNAAERRTEAGAETDAVIADERSAQPHDNDAVGRPADPSASATVEIIPPAGNRDGQTHQEEEPDQQNNHHDDGSEQPPQGLALKPRRRTVQGRPRNDSTASFASHFSAGTTATEQEMKDQDAAVGVVSAFRAALLHGDDHHHADDQHHRHGRDNDSPCLDDGSVSSHQHRHGHGHGNDTPRQGHRSDSDIPSSSPDTTAPPSALRGLDHQRSTDILRNRNRGPRSSKRPGGREEDGFTIDGDVSVQSPTRPDLVTQGIVQDAVWSGSAGSGSGNAAEETQGFGAHTMMSIRDDDADPVLPRPRSLRYDTTTDDAGTATHRSERAMLLSGTSQRVVSDDDDEAEADNGGNGDGQDHLPRPIDESQYRHGEQDLPPAASHTTASNSELLNLQVESLAIMRALSNDSIGTDQGVGAVGDGPAPVRDSNNHHHSDVALSPSSSNAPHHLGHQMPATGCPMSTSFSSDTSAGRIARARSPQSIPSPLDPDAISRTQAAKEAMMARHPQPQVQSETQSEQHEPTKPQPRQHVSDLDGHTSGHESQQQKRPSNVSGNEVPASSEDRPAHPEHPQVPHIPLAASSASGAPRNERRLSPTEGSEEHSVPTSASGATTGAAATSTAAAASLSKAGSPTGTGMKRRGSVVKIQLPDSDVFVPTGNFADRAFPLRTEPASSSVQGGQGGQLSSATRQEGESPSSPDPQQQQQQQQQQRSRERQEAVSPNEDGPSPRGQLALTYGAISVDSQTIDSSAAALISGGTATAAKADDRRGASGSPEPSHVFRGNADTTVSGGVKRELTSTPGASIAPSAAGSQRQSLSVPQGDDDGSSSFGGSLSRDLPFMDE